MMFNDKQFSIYDGRKLRVKIFGASHAKEIGVSAKGLDGITFDGAELERFMERRRAKNTAYSTKRLETDKVIVKKGLRGEVVSGEFKAIIKNTAKRR